MSTTLGAAAGWVQARALTVPRFVWRVAAIVLLAAAVAVVASGQGLRLAAPVALLGVLALAALDQWRRACRRSDKLVVFVSPFTEQTIGSNSVARVHTGELIRRFQRHRVLQDAFEFRILPHPLSSDAAVRLLSLAADARAVVGGDVLVAGSQARWECWMLTRVHEMGVHASMTDEGDARYSTADERLGQPQRSELPGDYDWPIQRFASKDFPLNHADGVEAVLFTMAGDGSDLLSEADCRLARRLAIRRQASLPSFFRVIIRSEEAIKWLDRGNARRAADIMVKIAHEENDEPIAWMHAAGLMTIAEQWDQSEPLNRLPIAKRAAELAPDNAAARYGYACAAMACGRHQKALEEVDAALQDPYGRVPDIYLWETRIDVLLCLGRRDEARREMRRQRRRLAFGARRWMSMSMYEELRDGIPHNYDGAHASTAVARRS